MSKGQIHEFKNFATNIIIIVPLKKKINSRILNFMKSPRIRNVNRKCKHAKITRSRPTVINLTGIPASKICLPCVSAMLVQLDKQREKKTYCVCPVISACHIIF